MPSTLNERFAKSVKHLRQLQRISQEEFAVAAETHRTYVSLVERGAANVTLDVVENFARAFNVEPCALICDQRWG